MHENWLLAQIEKNGSINSVRFSIQLNDIVSLAKGGNCPESGKVS
jgi:hypothetical protein